MDDTKQTPGGEGTTSFDYETNKGNTAKKLINPTIGDCALQDMSASNDRIDLNDV